MNQEIRAKKRSSYLKQCLFYVYVCWSVIFIFLFVLFLVPGSSHCQVIFAPVLTDIYARDSEFNRQGRFTNTLKKDTSGYFGRF